MTSIMSRTLVCQLFFLCNLFVLSKSCQKSQCLTFANKQGLSTEFQRLLAEQEEEEEGTRIVYFKLPKLNDDTSYKSLHSDRILPWRWTWARSNKEPILSLSYDYDVLSLGLLKNQVKELTLEFTSTQLECLKALNSSCQDLEIARALLDVTKASSNKPFAAETQVVCFRVLRELWFGIGSHFKYQCCKEEFLNNDRNGATINCHVPINESRWLAVFNAILAILVGVTVMYWPWIFYLVPKSLHSVEEHDSQSHGKNGTRCLPNDNTTQSNHIALDDFSPITLQALIKKLGKLYPAGTPDLRMQFFLLWFGLVPVFFYMKLLLYFIIKSDNFDETSQKLLFQVFNHYLFVFKIQRPLVYLLFIIPFFVIPCFVILFASAKRNREYLNSLIQANDKSADYIKEYFHFTKNLVSKLGTNKGFKFIDGKHKCIARPFSVAYNIFIVPICTVATIVALLITSILCVAICCPYLVFFWKIVTLLKTTVSEKKFAIHRPILLFYSSLSATILVIFSCQFAVRMVGFVIMGIILNAEFVVPYITFVFVISNNIHLCFRHTQDKYKEVKDIISEEWQELEPHAEKDRIPEKLFWSIVDPDKLFWSDVDDENPKKNKGNKTNKDKEDDQITDKDNVNVLFKFSTEMFRLFCRILAIVVFLSVALTAILLFKVTYGASAIIPTISVFISGKVSELFFTGVTTGSSFVGLEKIHLEKEIKRLVGSYKAKHNDIEMNSTSGTPTGERSEDNENATVQLSCLV